MSLSKYLARATDFADWFIPPEMAANREQRENARIFLYSHIFGPFIGNTVPLSIWLFDTHVDYRVAVLAASISSFWLFPPLLRAFGHYYTLSIVSVQNLIFCILWSCYFYGGLSSPTVAWTLTIPLLAFMYVGPSARMRTILIFQFLANAFLYFAICDSFTPPAPTLATPALQALGLVSTVAASAYVMMMALFYANALASQVELQSEMEQHLTTAADLLSSTEEARRSSTAKSDFIAKMSHELRTPLNAIIGYSEILIDDTEGDNDPTTASDLRRIRDAGQYLLKLVNRILDLSRIEAGRMEVAYELVDANDLIASIVRDVEPIASKNNNTATFERQKDLNLIRVDVQKLKLILSSLVENAAQYTRNGSIVVTTRWAGQRRDSLVIQVADNGPGIAPERVARLLGNFDSLEDDTDDRSTHGAGLGLALSKRLCGLIHASLAVETERGHGATFTVTLPLGDRAKPDNVTSEELGLALDKAEDGLKALTAVAAAMRAERKTSNRRKINAKAAAR